MDRLIAITFLLFSLSSHTSASDQVEIEEARVWTAPEQTRLVVDIAGPVSHRIVALKDPARLLIDIPSARFPGRLPGVDTADPLLLRLRAGSPNGRDLRLVLDLKQPVRVKSFLMPPNERYGHRLIVDLLPKGEGTASLLGESAPPLSPQDRQLFGSPARARVPDVVVAIDPGHGGEDPGAIGPEGTYEKDITLVIARHLATLIEREPGMRPILIRDGDYYVALRERIALARERDADLFVSIHADAFPDARIRGSSVFTLSVNGASSEAAEWLADRENNADRIGGIELADVDDDLNRVLFELAQNGAIEHSQYAARHVLTKLRDVGPLHHGDVQEARFVVLKSPDVPSILVETAFISNPDDERKLCDRDHQRRIAKAIFDGIRAYFAKHALPDARVVSAPRPGRRHIIDHGDTLIEIAKRYEVSLSALRVANSLAGDRIRVGDVLTIPEG